MLDNCINKNVFDQIFLNHSTKITIFLRASKNKGSNFDPFRETGYEKTTQNPFFIKGIIKSLAPNSLIIREMGLTESGALQLLIKDNDVSLIKLSKKMIIDGKEYYIYNDRIGNKLQIFPLRFGYSKLIVFQKDK